MLEIGSFGGLSHYSASGTDVLSVEYVRNLLHQTAEKGYWGIGRIEGGGLWGKEGEGGEGISEYRLACTVPIVSFIGR